MLNERPLALGQLQVTLNSVVNALVGSAASADVRPELAPARLRQQQLCASTLRPEATVQALFRKVLLEVLRERASVV